MAAYLIDTNVLVYAVNADDSRHADSRALLERSLRGETSWALADQNLLEFHAIVTDAKRAPRPLDPAKSADLLTSWLGCSSLEILRPGPRHWEVLGRLLKEHRVKGQDVFDARLAALLLESGVGAIYTYNPRGFSHYEGIAALEPPRHDPGSSS